MHAGTRMQLVAVAIALGCLAAWTAGSAAAKPRGLLGANLPGYVAPKKGACDLRVPDQFSTIQSAVDASGVGDTVCVGPGTYDENVRISHSIRLSGSGATKSIIVGQTTDPTVMTDPDGHVDNFTIEGFQIRGVDNTDPNRDDPTALEIGSSSSGVVVRYNWITSGFAQLVARAGGGQANDVFTNNVLEGVSSPEILKISGVEGPSTNVDVLNNTFVGTVDASVQNLSGSGTVLDTAAANSSISRNAFDTGLNVSVVVASTSPSNVVSENNFNNDAPVKIANNSAGELDATNNWWGDLDPANDVAGGVKVDPFASEPFAESTRCYGELFAATITHDLVTDSRCFVTNSTVDGNLKVDPGGSFGAFDAQITGNVSARNAAAVDIGFFVTIGGNVRITGSTESTSLARVNVGGGVTLDRNIGNLLIMESSVGKNLVVSSNSVGPDTNIRFTSVNGNADIRGNTGASIDLLFDTISGTLNCRKNNPPATVDGTTAGSAKGECA